MDFRLIIAIVLASVLLLFLLICYVCFRLTFYTTKKEKQYVEGQIPPGKVYLQYREILNRWEKEVKKFNSEELCIKSFDGLSLRATYYEFSKGAPIEIMFHGYRGSAARDLCGGILRCKRLGRNVITVDQRGAGKSDGNVISFGIKERYDVQSWAKFAYEKFGDKVKLILTGISMGASTVLLASSLELPKTVVGIIADCGYSSAKDIIKKVINGLGLCANLCYPFVRMGGKIFGGFDIEKTSPEKEMKDCKIPVIFLHGDEDEFVPKEMSQKNYGACNSAKEMVLIEGAGHGLAYAFDQEKYLKALKDFEKYYQF